MQVESKSREAFELVTAALESLDKYRESRDVAHLRAAKTSLFSAKSKDPQYFRAAYYGAMVDDLIGDQKAAVAGFRELLNQVPARTEEVRYNLGVALYHRYSHAPLEEAIACFKEVDKNATDNRVLRLLAQAGLAQAQAMHEIPKDPDHPNLDEIQSYFREATKQADRVLFDIHHGEERLDRNAMAEIGWTALNARGMALMYHSDYFPQAPEAGAKKHKVRQLKEALDELRKADDLSPSNWANYCDMASAQMRLGYWEQNHTHFDHALARLKVVIDKLRPGYGFAIYEIGRIHRLAGRFVEATSCFDQVKQISKETRDVGDARLDVELGRASRCETVFP